MKAAQLAHDLTYHPKRRMDLFRSLRVPGQAAVFEHLSSRVRSDLLDRLKDDEVVDLLDQMDLDRAQYVVAGVRNARRRRKIIDRLKEELKEKAEYFLRFHPKAGITLLNFNYVLLPAEAPIVDAIDAIDEHYRKIAKLPEVLVHEDGDLVGEVPFGALVRTRNVRKLGSLAVPIRSVSYLADIREIVDVFNETAHGKIAVLDKDGSVIGIIYSDDALALFRDEPTAALYDFAGVSESERSFDSVGRKVSHRYKWLIVNLATAFLAASVVGLFEDTLSRLVILAVYMPVIAGMGGNAATQTLAVIVRGITIGEISLANGLPVILREAGAGLLNGAIVGAIVAVVATLWNREPALGLVLAAAMTINLVVAGFFGALVPLVMKALRQDPATSATIFITTATDVCGFFTFLGLATIFLV